MRTDASAAFMKWRPSQTLLACGYIVADLGLPVAMVDKLLSKAKARTYEPVFKTVGGDEDGGLLQLKLFFSDCIYGSVV
ncbi:hypothetical protein PPTG_22003 [Phytophthora nicotianae INRA-310]|uniref:Uncharacterized protein n=1 Tax=Phytophthora nicotianae (strain INRA-310) TaxID=761204 RepID=W2QRL5_PHYN3|nr:hypothetical protein PPTG_22003 [Phytophthora nicotianae INRA-310]ETN15822.1 hypothetical protein PPTG_22003 [Phytophthora nicotianae INRA-310]